VKKSILVLSVLVLSSLLSACTATKTEETKQVSTAVSQIENADVVTDEPYTSGAVEQTEQAAIDWQTAVNELAISDQSSTEKVEATEKLAREYNPTTEELEVFKYHVLQEFMSFNYLKDGSNAEYMLSNLFQSIVLEHHEVPVVRDFALAFYHNTKNVFTGVEEMDSDSVKAYEEQLYKALNHGT